MILKSVPVFKRRERVGIFSGRGCAQQQHFRFHANDWHIARRNPDVADQHDGHGRRTNNAERRTLES